MREKTTIGLNGNNVGRTNNKSYYYMVAMLILSLSFWVGCEKEVTQKGWYDYGNGLVNLSNTNLIQSEMSFTLILDEKDKSGSNIEVEIINGPISKNNVETAITSLQVKGENLNVKSVEWNASIGFDAFTIKLPGFDEAGISFDSIDSCIKLIELWYRTYSDLVGYIDPYKA